MEKPKIFISHVTEEKDLANIIKNEISKAFLGLPEIFVSSDTQSISVGQKWLDEIDQALKGAQIMLILCSKNSVRRPWINFEAGAGWTKGIPIVPICHTNLRPVELPIPLNMLQGINATDKEDLEKVIDLVAKQLGAGFTPDIQYNRIIEEIKSFEKEYGVIEVVKQEVKELMKIEPQLEQLFNPSAGIFKISGFLSDLIVDKLVPHLNILKEMGFVDYSKGRNQIVFHSNGGGNEIEFNLIVKEAYYKIAEKVME